MRRIGVALVVVVAGCRGDGVSAPESLDFSAVSAVGQFSVLKSTAPAIETTVTIANNTGHTFSLRTGDCGTTGLRVFATPDMTGTPVWSTFDTPILCSAILIVPTPLNPGESRQVFLYVYVNTVLGAMLPTGTYYVDAVLGYYSPQISSNQIHLNAGAVQLSR